MINHDSDFELSTYLNGNRTCSVMATPSILGSLSSPSVSGLVSILYARECDFGGTELPMPLASFFPLA